MSWRKPCHTPHESVGRWTLGFAALFTFLACTVPAVAQQDDSDLLAPLVPPAADDDLLAPLVPPPSDDNLLAPLVPPPSDDDLLAPLVPDKQASDDDLLEPLVPASEFEDDLLAPLVAPNSSARPKELSEEELIEKGAATLRSPDDAAAAIAHAIEWAGRGMQKAMKGKISDEEMKRTLEAIEKMDGMTELRTPKPRPGKKPLPLEIDVEEQMEWQRKQQESNGTLVLVEKPMEVTQCTAAGVCSQKLKMHYELQPVTKAGTAP